MNNTTEYKGYKMKIPKKIVRKTKKNQHKKPKNSILKVIDNNNLFSSELLHGEFSNNQWGYEIIDHDPYQIGGSLSGRLDISFSEAVKRFWKDVEWYRKKYNLIITEL